MLKIANFRHHGNKGLLPVCFTYWPRKYTTRVDPNVDNSHQVWSWYDHTLPIYSVLSVDTSRDLVTLTFDLLTLNSCHAWRVTWLTLPPSLKTLRLFVHELRVITVPTDYHWKCVPGHCACAESRDLWIGDQKQLHFWNPRPRFAYSLYTFGGSKMKIIKFICENNAQPALKTYEFLRMRQITWSVKDALNVFLQSFSSTSTYRIKLQKLSMWSKKALLLSSTSPFSQCADK